MIWIEDVGNSILYNSNGTSLFKQDDKTLILESSTYTFSKEYIDVAAATVKYNAFKAAIVSSGGVVVTP